MDRIIEFLIKVITAIGTILGIIGEILAEAFAEWYYNHRERVPYYVFCLFMFLISCGILQWAIWSIQQLFRNMLG